VSLHDNNPITRAASFGIQAGSGKRNPWPARRHSVLWFAALLHRLSGLGLAIFLPLHFLTLGLALRSEAQLEHFLRFTDAPLVRLSEGGLVFLLVVHALGGLRLLAVENLPWYGGQKRLAALAAAAAAGIAIVFLLVLVR
jgi:fumarate reductase subunit D